jgi:hypothetical protein
MQNSTKVGAILFVICIALMVACGLHFKGYGDKPKWIKVCAPIGFILGLCGFLYSGACFYWGDAMFAIDTAKAAVKTSRENLATGVQETKTRFVNAKNAFSGPLER